MPPDPRISYSFTAPVFDLDRMQPKLWQSGGDGRTLILNLQPRWEALLPALSGLDLVMACAVAGPLSLATALAPASMNPVPDSCLWLCLESGTELNAAVLGAAAVVIEHQDGHTFASLQFFDRSGEGALKLLATNGTDLECFHDLARQFGTGQQRISNALPPPAALDLAAPQGKTLCAIRAHWLSLTRSLPDDFFPGHPGVPRLAALRAAGPGLAWRAPQKAALAAVSALTLHDGPLGAAVRTAAAFVPCGFYPQRFKTCGCGATFFSDAVQLTLRRRHAPGAEVWVTRFANHRQDVRCLEFYDGNGRFCGGIGLRPEADDTHHALWNSILSCPAVA